MPSTTTATCQAKASYKKIPGLLELTQTHLQWTQQGKQAPVVRIEHKDAASLFCSKEGSPQVKLKLGLVGNDAGHTFMFTSPQANADRETFKTEITKIISRNRSTSASVDNGAVSAKALASSIQRAATSSVSRATSVSSNDRMSIAPSGLMDDYHIRKKVLMKSPELATLHRELVMTGQITENEFWEGREHLLMAEAVQESQKRGKPGQLVDPRPETMPSGDVKIKITPQLIHDIFDEYPVVARAYNETVPNLLSEAQFWTRYFQSRLFNSHRASIRSTAAQHVVKDDPIFDKYIERADDELEPRRQRDEDVELLVNLVATAEDHLETGNRKDSTMQPGKQRGALPLIRRFNEHSERLLNAAEGSPRKRQRLDKDITSYYYSQIDLEDLHDDQSSMGIILEMQDRDRYYNGRSLTSATGKGDANLTFRAALPHVKAQAADWSTALKNLRIEKEAGNSALQSMTQNVHARLEVKLRKNDITDGLYSQMTTCQTAANEFLRQFWAAIYPPQSDFPTVGGSSNAAAKAAKAAKMAGYLEKTPEKIRAIVQTAEHAGVDRTKVELAMKPVSDAVEKALQFYNTRKPAR